MGTYSRHLTIEVDGERFELRRPSAADFADFSDASLTSQKSMGPMARSMTAFVTDHFVSSSVEFDGEKMTAADVAILPINVLSAIVNGLSDAMLPSADTLGKLAATSG